MKNENKMKFQVTCEECGKIGYFIADESKFHGRETAYSLCCGFQSKLVRIKQRVYIPPVKNPMSIHDQASKEVFEIIKKAKG